MGSDAKHVALPVVRSTTVYYVRHPRHREYECGHHSDADGAYDDLATSLMLKCARYHDTDDEAALDRYEAVQRRLVRWLMWRDESVRDTGDTEGEPNDEE